MGVILVTKRLAGLAVAAAVAAPVVLSAAPASAGPCAGGYLTPEIVCTVRDLLEP
jgi:hypothetical protein